MALSPDGNLACGSADCTVKLWDLQTEQGMTPSQNLRWTWECRVIPTVAGL
ncbi:WD40 repeat domain-containing protein [Oscillatoria sp. HE19RPO]|uniref:WD40 repeat domain-containing protein n=1 Tax=Oscillatoria sp. HE19RPO TaxID=2954806 RepID=UPI0020C5A0AF|nr:WD40 repeat domain-containing protein [Oscillatoria sp. HE19RPO]